MCLDTLRAGKKLWPYELAKLKTDTAIEAWKVFEITACEPQGALLFPHHNHRGHYRVTQGRWLKAEGTRYIKTGIWIGDDESRVRYRPGFHVFLSKTDAISYDGGGVSTRVVRVKVRHVTAVGTQLTTRGHITTLVAQHMIVPRQKKAKVKR